MPFWSGETLLARAQSSKLIEPFDEKQIDCNAYTLKMGGEYYATTDGTSHGQTTQIKDGKSFNIPTGQFAYLLSKEWIRVPCDAMAFISMRTGVKLQGLINVSGFHVDPGYEGRLVYAVYNASPSTIELREDQLLFKIWFCKLDTFSSLTFNKPGTSAISSDMIRGMDSANISLQALSKQLTDHVTATATKFAEQKTTVDFLTFVVRAAVIAAAFGLFVLIAPPARDFGETVSKAMQALFTVNQLPQSPPPTPPTRNPAK